MISWVWLIPAVIVGEIIGISAIAICHGSWDKEDEKEWAIKNGLLYAENEKTRQCCNTDGSEKGVSDV